MKKAYLYILASILACGAVSCNSDDPSDACAKHVYGEGEAPYLRSDAGATATSHIVFKVSEIDEPQYLDLKQFAPYFHKNLNMTVDEAIAAISNGEVQLYNINSARQCWNLAEPNCGFGWYYNTGGQVTASESAAFSAEFDQTTKSIEFHALNGVAAGTMTNLDLGFVLKNGKDFDDYVRFTVTLEVTDPSIMDCKGIVPGGDYNVWTLDFAQYDAQLKAALDIDAKEFIKLWGSCEDADHSANPIQMYLMKNGERVADANGFMPGTTSGYMGWWLDRDLNITTWGTDGFFMFLESTGSALNFGRAPGVESGTQMTVLVDFALTEDLNKHITFKVSLTFE